MPRSDQIVIFVTSPHSPLQSLITNIRSEVGALEGDLGDRFVGSLLRVGQGIAQCGDSEDSATVGDDSVVFPFGAAVEDFDVGHFGDFIEAGDRLAGFDLAGVTAGRHHDAHGRAGVPNHLLFGQVAELFVKFH